ncbi:MAG: ribonuclease P protein component [Planctomycetes bacterium]|nr:ribonuclease P protein component [Planctomycetota bacterium]
MENHPQSERFPRRSKLSGQNAFDRVFSAKNFASDPVLIIHCVKNGLTYSRLGISASRRLGNAVVRNYWKRLIREAFRRQQAQLPIGLDLVVRPQRNAVPDSAAIAKSMLSLARRLHRRESMN